MSVRKDDMYSRLAEENACIRARIVELTERLAAMEPELATTKADRDFWRNSAIDWRPLVDFIMARGDFIPVGHAGGDAERIIRRQDVELARLQARVAELEGAREKAKDTRTLNAREAWNVIEGRALAASLRESWDLSVADSIKLLDDRDRMESVIAKQAVELERLRILITTIRELAPNGTRGLGSIALDVFAAVNAFDARNPAPAIAQAEAQMPGELVGFSKGREGHRVPEGSTDLTVRLATADVMKDPVAIGQKMVVVRAAQPSGEGAGR